MVTKRKTVNIRAIFHGLQDQMRSKLTSNRAVLPHPVTKGDASELEWIKMLSTYLPNRYKADKAFVIDCEGHISEQIDIVIYDRHYSPFIFNQNGALYIPAESVYAVIEVKPELNNKHIEYAAIKAESVRILKRTTAPIVHAAGKVVKPKKPFNILAGILAIDGTCGKSQLVKLRKLSSTKFLQFGCSLYKESFWFKYNKSRKCIFSKSTREEALIYFFLNLLGELQQLGTVSAIDINEYIKNLG